MAARVCRRPRRVCRVAVPGGRVMVTYATTRSPTLYRRACIAVFAVLALAALVSGSGFDVAHAQAPQLLQFPSRPAPILPAQRPAGDKAPMLLQAMEINYDYVNKRVSAVGS